ncbi:MAG: hypothetical protein ACI4S4_04540, partial [Candidatus Ornithospirochaeta sp.]
CEHEELGGTMGKAPELNITLREIDKLFLDASPLMRIVPLKIRMAFFDMKSEELKNLEEYANADDGCLERWILVPDSIPLAVLGLVINRAFGLPPQIFGNYFTLEDEDWNKLCPNMETFFTNCGSVFDNPGEVEYSVAVGAMGLDSKNGIPPVLPALVLGPRHTYEEAQKELAEQVSAIRKNGIDYKGKVLSTSECPAELNLILNKVKDPDSFALTDCLCPDLQLKDVLTRKGKRLYSLDERPKKKRDLADKSRPKPFADKLLMLLFDDEDYVTFTFEVTMPENVYSLIKEGYLSTTEYMESIKYVLQTLSPDCIYKKGYDLFGPDQYFYHDFIMAIHGPDAEKYLQEARSSGWREPYIDLKKVLR